MHTKTCYNYYGVVIAINMTTLTWQLWSPIYDDSAWVWAKQRRNQQAPLSNIHCHQGSRACNITSLKLAKELVQLASPFQIAKCRQVSLMTSKLVPCTSTLNSQPAGTELSQWWSQFPYHQQAPFNTFRVHNPCHIQTATFSWYSHLWFS